MSKGARYIGIDPGGSGGIACLHEQGQVELVSKMPETEQDVLALLHGCSALARAALERVHGGAFSGGRRAGASSMFSFGRNYGALLMALTAVQVPFDTVPPQTWQKVLSVIYPKGSSQTERKNISKRRAQQLFPSVTVTHAVADALLLAEYCRRAGSRS